AVPDPARVAARAAHLLPDEGHECTHRGGGPDRQDDQEGRTRVPQPSELPMPHHWLRAPTDRGVTPGTTLKVEEPSFFLFLWRPAQIRNGRWARLPTGSPSHRLARTRCPGGRCRTAAGATG